MSQALTLNNLSKRFGKQEAVNQVSLEIREGEFLALLGPSGCGKTTLLRCLAGLESPSDGELELAGRTVFSGSKGIDLPPQEREVGFVFQDLGLWPHQTVLGHLLFVLQSKHDKAAATKLAMEQLQSLQIDHLAKKKPAQLSGGESQRLALARALVTNPGVLFMDEPLASLDSAVAQEIRRLLVEIKKSGKTTIVYVTHSRDEALELGDRIAVMRNGSLEQVAAPEELYARPNSSFVATFLGNCNIIGGELERDQGVLHTVLGDFSLNESGMSMKQPALVLRDHQIFAAADGIPAKVVMSRFCGADFVWEVIVGEQKLQMRGTHGANAGAEITIAVGGTPWYVEEGKE